MKAFLLIVFVFWNCFDSFAQPSGIQVSIQTTIDCNYDGTAKAVVNGGVPPYTYVWTRLDKPGFAPQFTDSIFNLIQGEYQVIVTDANGDTSSFRHEVRQAYNISVSLIQLDSCHSGTGKAIAQFFRNFYPYPVSPVSYLWTTGDTTLVVSGITTGTMLGLTVIDSNGCRTNSFEGLYMDDTLTTPNTRQGYCWSRMQGFAGFLPIEIITPANCQDGAILIDTILEGTPPFSYSWNTNPVQTGNSITNLSPGKYECTITDAAGCFQTFSFSVPTSSVHQVSADISPDTCHLGIGKIEVSSTTATPPITYLWSNGSTSNIIDSLLAGAYTYTLTDAIGCIITNTVIVPSVSRITSAVFSETTPSCDSSNGSLTIQPNGGTSPYFIKWFTLPVQYGSTATGLASGTYSALVTDSLGCTRSFSYALNDNSTLTLTFSSTNDICSSGQGTASAIASLGTPPYTYTWNTQPVQNNPVATSLVPGNYVLTLEDALGCEVEKKFQIGNTSSINVQASITAATCLYSTDGSITLTPSGGTPPYNYLWANSSTGATATNLASGTHMVLISDANGCQRWYSAFVPYLSTSPCSFSIEGNLYSDFNSDCLPTLEPGYSGVFIFLNNTQGYLTDPNGYYKFYSPNFGSNTLNFTAPKWHTTSCPTPPYSFTAAMGQLLVQNFPLTGTGIDLDVRSTSVNPPRPGFDFFYNVQYRNRGAASSGSSYIKVKYDNSLSYISSNPSPLSFNALTGEIVYALGNLVPGDLFNTIQIQFSVLAQKAIGDILVFTDSIYNGLADLDFSNNIFSENVVVVGPYDPNDISVSPKGEGDLGWISSVDSVLRYKVRFQNTGNYPAMNVKVELPFSSSLRPTSLTYLGSSHPCEVYLNEDGKLIFMFTAINLPDSTSNEPKSHGYCEFSAMLWPNSLPGTEAKMSADIYFDFNASVATNQVQNTLRFPTTLNLGSSNLYLYPNPASEKLSLLLTSSEAINSLELYAAGGRLLASPAYTEVRIDEQHFLYTLDLQSLGLSNGLYLLRLGSPSNSYSQRFVFVGGE